MKISVLLLAMLAAGAVSAEPGHGGRGGRGFFGFGQGHNAGRDPVRREEALQRQQDRRAERNQAIGAERCNDSACANRENGTKRNRLTPEERRALRRQIQNAGQELYLPGR